MFFEFDWTYNDHDCVLQNGGLSSKIPFGPSKMDTYVAHCSAFWWICTSDFSLQKYPDISTKFSFLGPTGFYTRNFS